MNMESADIKVSGAGNEELRIIFLGSFGRILYHGLELVNKDFDHAYLVAEFTFIFMMLLKNQKITYYFKNSIYLFTHFYAHFCCLSTVS